MTREHGTSLPIHMYPIDAEGRGNHIIQGFVSVTDETARLAISQSSIDRGRIVEQTAGLVPGFYMADGAGGWLYIGGFTDEGIGGFDVLTGQHRVFNILSYGAVADGDGAGGGTDNSTAFQACSDAINAAGGGRMYIPNGIYRKDSETIIYNNTRVIGESTYMESHGASFAGTVIDATNLALGGAYYRGVFRANTANGYDTWFENLTIIGVDGESLSAQTQNFLYGLNGIILEGSHRQGGCINVFVFGFHYGITLEYNISRVILFQCMASHSKYGNINLRGVNGVQLVACSSIEPRGDGLVLSQGGLPTCSGVIADMYVIDEAVNGSSVNMINAADCSLRTPTIWTGATAGIEITNGSNVRIYDARIARYGGGAIQANSISIDADSSGIQIFGVKTEPNGGGDVSDSAPDTRYHKCDLGGVYVDTMGSLGYGGSITRYTKTATATLSGATTDIDVDIPSGARIISTASNNDTAISGATSYDLAYITGSTQAIAGSVAVTQNTKVNKPFDVNAATDITSALTKIRATANGGSFSGGTIRVVSTYEVMSNLIDT